MGDYIEVGQFQSVRSRAGTKWSEAKRQKHKEKRKISTINNTMKRMQLQATKSKPIRGKVFHDVITKVKIKILEAIDEANRQIPMEFPREKNE